MISYGNVVTYGTTQTRWLSNITDLAMAQIGAGWMLFAVNATGGVSSYRITDPLAPLEQVGTAAFPLNFTYHAAPALTVLAGGGSGNLLVAGVSDAGVAGLAFDATGLPGSFAQLFPADLIGERLSASGQFIGNGDRFLFSAQQDSLTIEVSRINSNGSLAPVSQASLPLPAGVAEASLDKIIAITVGNQPMLVAISGLGNFISTHAIGAGGILDTGSMHVAAEGMGYYIPSDIAAVQVGGRSFLVVAGASSSSLSVFQLDATGTLTATDHIVDEMTTRFQAVTALATAVVDGRGFVIAGGADGGISIFTLLPDGRLLHLQTLADTNNMTLGKVGAIEATVIAGKIALFVTSAGETGVTQLVIDPGTIGATGFAGAGTATGGRDDDLLVASANTTDLQGGAGDDILVTARSNVTLTGGDGADTFAITRFDGRVMISDYEAGTDTLDLSNLGMIRSVWQLNFAPQSWGMRIIYGNSILEIRTRDGSTLQPVDFGNWMFPIAHYGLPALQPQPVEPPATTVGNWIFGTDAADTLLGGGGNDAIQAGGGEDVVSAGAGDDTVQGEGGSDLLRGGSGNDDLKGQAGNDTLFGDEDNDTLSGGDGDDLIYGGLGQDSVSGGAGHDLIYGGAGADRLFGDAGNDTLSGEEGDDYLEDLTGDNDLLGSAGNDRLIAGAGLDRLWGGDGNDLLQGGAGADWLDGEAGHDTLWGGSGNDQLKDLFGNNQFVGGDGNDTLVAGAGIDMLHGNNGNDVLYGRAGNDSLWGDTENDRLYGDYGNDALAGGAGNDSLYGGAGNDSLYGAWGWDVLQGGYGNDLLVDPFGNNLLTGDAGNDTLRAGGGSDSLHGGAGNDSLLGGAGNDRIWGDIGNDRIFGEAGNDLVHDLTGNNLVDGGSENDQIRTGSGLDTLFGGAGGDVLWAGANHDSLNGGPGNDTLYGEAGNDILVDPGGHNILWGGLGNDRLQAGWGNDRLYGDGGNDTLAGGSGNDALRGGPGYDRLMGQLGNDSLWGDDGNDSMWGDGGDDFLWGGSGNDSMLGGPGFDRLSGDGGNDLLNGGDLGDRLWGGNGNDTLIGGAGADNLWGGPGADVFRFVFLSDSRVSAPDLIHDFAPNIDHLDFRAVGLGYIDTSGFTAARQLRWQYYGHETRVMADLNGDGRADFLLRLLGHLDLDRGDFLL